MLLAVMPAFDWNVVALVLVDLNGFVQQIREFGRTFCCLRDGLTKTIEASADTLQSIFINGFHRSATAEHSKQRFARAFSHLALKRKREGNERNLYLPLHLLKPK